MKIERVKGPLTAYDLLGRVRDVILEEPKRYDQGIWAANLTDYDEVYGLNNTFPACGTIACVAGWTSVLVDGPGYYRGAQVEWRAKTLLGLADWQTVELFGFDLFNGLLNEWYTENGKAWPVQGTREYAEAGAEHIRRFMAKYEFQLRLKLVPTRNGEVQVGSET